MDNAKTIRIGIIGAGFARTTQILGFKNCKGARLFAIASAHREHAEEGARESDIEHVECRLAFTTTRFLLLQPELSTGQSQIGEAIRRLVDVLKFGYFG